MKLSVVIPARDEGGSVAETIQGVLDALRAASIPLEVVVVDDGSRDDTAARVRQLAVHNPEVVLTQNTGRHGFGMAVRHGIEHATGDAVAILMADASDSPADLVTYYRKLEEGWDCVFGSRFIRGGHVHDYPVHKLVINRLANWFIRTIFGLRLNDTTNAFKAYRRHTIDGIQPLISPHFNLTVEMPLKAIVRGYSYAVIPIGWTNRQAGVSKLKLKEMGSRYLFIVMYIWLERALARGDYHRRQRAAEPVKPTTYDHILITGAAGFVGSSLAVDLRRRFPALRVTAFDNLNRRGSELNLPRLAEAGVRFVHGDVRSPEDLRGLSDAPGLLIECSAEVAVQAGYGGSPEGLIRTNLGGCFHCLDYARTVKSDFLFVSTSRVYPVAGLNAVAWQEDATRFCWPGSTGVSETFPLEGARSLYGMTKLAGELMAAEYADAYGMKVAIIRSGLIAGPWQMGKSDQGVVTLWVAAHYFGRPLQYIGFGGTGKQLRDILHIDDFCDLVADQVARFDRYAGQTFNAGGGLRHSASLLELTRACEEVTGNRIQIASEPAGRKSDLRVYLTDHRRLTAATGWEPRRGVAAVVQDITRWIHENEAAVRPLLGK